MRPVTEFGPSVSGQSTHGIGTNIGDVAEALFEALQEDELEVFYDKNEQHRILAQDVEEYLTPIYSSDAQLVICILGPDYPKRVWTKFESEQFKERFKSGDVVPIAMSTAPLGVFDTATKVGYIAWDRTGDFDKQVANCVDVLKRKCMEVRARVRREAEKALVARVAEHSAKATEV